MAWMNDMAGMLFPACAGVILLTPVAYMDGTPVPRMCGGDPKVKIYDDKGKHCSPHVRG